MIGNNIAKQLLPLSNDTIAHQIGNKADDIEH